MFRQRVKFGFGQVLQLRCDTLNRSAARDEAVRARGAFSVLTVADAVVQSLELVLLLLQFMLVVCVLLV